MPGRRTNHAPAPTRRPAAVRALSLLIFLCLAIRLAAALGANSAAENFMLELASNSSAVVQLLDFEIGSGGAENVPQELRSLLFGPRERGTDAPPEPVPPGAAPGNTPAPATQGPDGGPFFGSSPPSATEVSPTAPAPILPEDAVSAPPEAASDILIKNKTDYALDLPALYAEPLNIQLERDKPAVLILHSHGSEAYTQHGDDRHVESDPYRTEDTRYNVVRVGDELAAALEEHGVAVIHDRAIYDFPSYAGSYTRSNTAIQDYLAQYPSIRVVIDLHRDAIEAEDGAQYRTNAQIGDVKCSQVMLYVGTDAAGLNHPSWRENFKLALHFQYEMDTRYPSLSRPIRVSQYRYNQNATLGSMIVEVGTAGNTLEESVTAMRYFASAAAAILGGLYA